MITARQKVLDYLKKNRAVSAREIARALKMSAPNVRHHLGVLVADGRAEVMSARKREGKGRPEKLYSLSRAALGDNLAGLADAILMEAGSGVEMEAVGRRLASQTGLSVETSQSIAKMLASVLEKLNEAHYMARWEAGAEGPRVIFGLCPYAAIIAKHPELCKMDMAMLSTMLRHDVEQRTKLSPVCMFVMK
jgi:predicted ArsR family transcriptional regulator